MTTPHQYTRNNTIPNHQTYQLYSPSHEGPIFGSQPKSQTDQLNMFATYAQPTFPSFYSPRKTQHKFHIPCFLSDHLLLCVFIIPEYFTDIFLLCSFKDTGMLFKNIFI